MNKYIKHAINSWMTSVRDIPDRLNDDKAIMKARDKMKKQFDKVYWQYHDLVFTYKKAFQSFGSWIRGKGATKQTYGDILNAGGKRVVFWISLRISFRISDPISGQVFSQLSTSENRP